MLRIIGVGICEGHMTDRAKNFIEKAEIVYGSERALKLADKWVRGEKILMKKFDKDVYSEIAKEGEKREVAVLSTGDPMVAGLGKFFRSAEVEPGISSVQLALSKLKVDLCEVLVVNAHGKKLEIGKRGLLILTDKNFDLSALGKKEIIVLEDLCSAERIKRGTTEDIKLESNNAIIYLGD
ncbi:MAG: precorrin-6y C5,15-methyltransferase (decarboxylating) subunit CbiE [Archaeoglobaceae archaeon]|nr:precorrin-6y C5,15-methyltransferase (decarboxylating) subunit CbiE [Archaeoglobaceae archaeon]